MTTQAFEKTLDELDLVYFDIQAISGKSTLDETEIPEEDRKAVRPGTVSHFDMAHLRPFERIRKEVRRIALQHGTRLMGGFAFPKANTQSFLDAIQHTKAEWDEAVTEFIGHYDDYVDQWCLENPTRAPTIRFSRPPRDALLGKFRFAYQGFTIASAGVAGSTILEEDIQGLPAQVCAEVAQDLKHNFDGQKGVVSQRVRRLLQRTRTKFDSFAFLDPALANASARIKDALDALPKAGPIAGNDFLILAGLVGVLQQPAKVLAGQLETVIPVASPQDELFDEEEDEATPAPVFGQPLAEQMPTAVVSNPPAASLDFNW